MNIIPPVVKINTAVIMDGGILEKNLKRLWLNMEWLEKELACQGYKSAKEVILGICDDNHKLSLFA